MRLFILLIMTLLIQGCTPSQQSIIETFNASLDGRQDVTVTDGQIQVLPYSTMYLRLDTTEDPGGSRIHRTEKQ